MPQALAYAATSPTSPLAPFALERRSPGPLDVALDILHCGVCHSDMHEIDAAYERMLKSDVKYRFVVDMATLPTETHTA